MPEALYVIDGGMARPSRWTAGPWSPEAQHGGPIGALLARAIERVGGPEELTVVRITIELQRPVPLQPLEVSAVISRPGRKVDVVEAELHHNTTLLARARALRIRSADIEIPEEAFGLSSALPTDPLATPPYQADPWAWPTFHIDAMEMRYVVGSWEEPGPALVWERLRMPVVDGEQPSALQRAVAAADSGNGISWVVPFEDYSFINPDLTVALSRTPVGEWIGVDASTRLNAQGWGHSESLMFDPLGPCGRAVQSLIVTPSSAAPS